MIDPPDLPAPRPHDHDDSLGFFVGGLNGLAIVIVMLGLLYCAWKVAKWECAEAANAGIEQAGADIYSGWFQQRCGPFEEPYRHSLRDRSICVRRA